MRPLTYFAFTLLSVVIQFCVMDFIQHQIVPDNIPIYLNSTNESHKYSIGILKDYASDAHALYYRLKKNDANEEISGLSDVKYVNTSTLPQSNQDFISTTTDVSLTIFDLIYDDDNVSETYGSTTETLFTSTELDNVTEITLFEETSTSIKPNVAITKVRNKDKCFCDLLYKQCDLHCCCDVDCTTKEKELFDQCKPETLISRKKESWEQFKCDADGIGGFNTFFCIVKTNLPEKRIIMKQKINKVLIKDAFFWHDNYKTATSHDFKRNFYSHDDHVWVLRNKSVDHLDLPASITNNYCNIRRPMKFLRNEKITCQLKYKDLEMFHVLETVEHSTVISVTNHSLNNTHMNCSSLYCSNWTITYCDDQDCVSYNKSLHEPKCTDSWCSNVAQKLEYVFHVFDTKIVSAEIKLYAQRVPVTVKYMTQEVNVQFLMGNASIVRPVKLSGNPGYVMGLPIIVSFADTNHTYHFFNNSKDNELSLPSNSGGACIKSRITKKVLQFGYNKRMKCKITFRLKPFTNGTEACTSVQSHIDEMLSVDRKTYISPYGNPDNVNDDNWLPMELNKPFTYGEFHSQRSKLHCFNLQTRLAFVFTYADFSDREVEENRILSAQLVGFERNVTFSTEEFSAVITIDINFINLNKLTQYDIAGPPHLNLNLPRDFFLPLSSNECNICRVNIHLISYLCIAILLTK